MTEKTANVEAQRLWGDDGVAWYPAREVRGTWRFCAVGIRVGNCRNDWIARGRGKTFEDAFLQAQARGS